MGKRDEKERGQWKGDDEGAFGGDENGNAANSRIFGLVAPHVPTLLEEELDGREGGVIGALRSLGLRLREEEIDCILAASTHWQTDQFLVDDGAYHKTVYDYYGFRTEVEYDARGYPDLAMDLIRQGEQDLLFPKAARRGADHAVTIPLHFLFPGKEIPVIPLSVAGSPLEAFRWGRSMAGVIRRRGLRVLFLASGALSHDLEAWMFRDNDPVYERFDRKVLGLLQAGRGTELTDMERSLVSRAQPEGSFRDIYMLLGAAGCNAPGELLAYESLPGVGMGVVFYDGGFGRSDEAGSIGEEKRGEQRYG